MVKKKRGPGRPRRRGRPKGSRNKIIEGLKEALEFKIIVPSFDLRLENAISYLEAAIQDTVNTLKGNTEQDITDMKGTN